MRTTLDIDDELMNALTSEYPNLSKTEAIETVIRRSLSEAAAEGLRRIAGSLEIEDASEASRRDDRHT